MAAAASFALSHAPTLSHTLSGYAGSGLSVPLGSVHSIRTRPPDAVRTVAWRGTGGVSGFALC